MKARYGLLPWLVITASLIDHSQAATIQYWNAGGDDNWGTSPGNKNWNVVMSGPLTTNTVWPDTGNEIAAFQDAIGGTVTVFDPVQTCGIIQNGANFSINAGIITLVQDLAMAQPFIDVQTGTLTIDSTLDGTNGLIKNGSGNLRLSTDETYTGTTTLSAGTLTLLGSLASEAIDIGANAILLDQSGGLADGTTLTNAGNLTISASDTIAAYVSNGGTLTAGSGTLTATTYNLNDGTNVIGHLGLGTLNSNGVVDTSGTIDALTVNVQTGTLTNTGTLGQVATHIDIAGGATLTASGTQNYALLTTSGPEPGIWQGDLTNMTAVAPGGAGGIGALRVAGDFTNAPDGVLQIDVAAAAHDLLDGQGSVNWGGTLELNQVGTAALAYFVPIQVVAADSYSGNITTLTSNLDAAVWFNPANGSVMMLADTYDASHRFGGVSNQTSTWIALYDDVIAPDEINVIYHPGSRTYQIISGIANPGNPDLLWALEASFTPAGLNANVLNRLSPEVYASFQDYAMQATRTHQRTAFSAPALVTSHQTESTTDSKGGGKNALPNPVTKPEWELFAATDYFDVETTSSPNQANYQLSGQGVIAGVRAMAAERLKLASYFAGDVGDVDGSLIDAHAAGWSLGLLGEFLLDAKSDTRLTAGISYGSYTFNGTRDSASATAAGWAPGEVSLDDVHGDSLELALGVTSVIYQNDRLRVIPSLGLRYATGTTDSFTETTGSTLGSPIALSVNHDSYDSALTEIAVLAEAEVTDKLVLWTQTGASFGLVGQSPVITGRFASGSRSMRAEADGLPNDLWFIGVGANYRVSDFIAVGLGCRSEFRSGADHMNSINLSTVFRF